MDDHLATLDMGRKRGRAAVPLWGELGPHLTQCGLGRGLPPYSVPSAILIHPLVWPQQTWAENLGVLYLFRRGELGCYLTQCGLGRGLLLYHVAS